jgi:hypothetical protein
MLRKTPAFTAAVVLTLTLGIGANTAIFSLLDAVLLRTLPIEHPEELERLDGYFSYPLFRELRTRNEVFSGFVARQTTPVSVAAAGRTDRAVVELVSGNFFDVLGLRCLAGPSPRRMTGRRWRTLSPCSAITNGASDSRLIRQSSENRSESTTIHSP